MSHEHHHSGDERRLTAMLPFVRGHLPRAPARVLEIGCGPLGGFVPALQQLGYDAVGVDPQAPQGHGFVQTEFEQYDLQQAVDVVIACASLHHVADLDEVLDAVRSSLAPAGVVVVVEWAHERFDEPTARWCFDRLPEGDHDSGQDGDSWLTRHYDDWSASGLAWAEYWSQWSEAEGMHSGSAIVAGLHARFDCLKLMHGPYFFSGLGRTSDEEQAAIDAGAIQPNGIRYVGRRR
jgi:SAM-dependent methyltransferase